MRNQAATATHKDTDTYKQTDRQKNDGHGSSPLNRHLARVSLREGPLLSVLIFDLMLVTKMTHLTPCAKMTPIF